MIKISQKDPNISQIIDTGVDGILFPHVEEKSQLDNIIKTESNEDVCNFT